MKDHVPKFALVTGASLFGDAIFILAAELSIACFPDNSAQSRTAAWDRTKCGSLFVRYVGLLSPKGPKASEFVAVLNLEGPSVQSVTVASASRDVLQRLQVPNFDA